MNLWTRVIFCFICSFYYTAVLVSAQELPPAEEEFTSPFFDVGDIEAPKTEDDLIVHGRIDLTFWHFESSKNLDGFKQNDLNFLSPALILSYRLQEQIILRGEFELDGKSGKFEVDHFQLRWSPRSRWYPGRGEEEEGYSGYLALGIDYIPFGVERHYYSSVRNALVDRPAPFRRLYPGTYSDMGVFGHGRWQQENYAFGLEASLTRGLRGPDRDDRADGWIREYDSPQLAGRWGIDFFKTPLPGQVELGFSGLVVNSKRRSTSGRRRLDLLGLDLTWKNELSYIRGEYVQSRYQGRASEGGSLRREGWYVETYRRKPVGLRWLQAMEFVARVDSLNTNSPENAVREAVRWAFGINGVINDSFRLKTEAIFSVERGRAVDNDGFFIQLEYHF